MIVFNSIIQSAALMLNITNWPKKDAKRQEWTPSHIEVGGFTYSFRRYGSKKFRRCSYRCIHGSSNSKNPCPAILKVDFSPDNTVMKFFLAKEHNCSRKNSLPAPYYSNLQIQVKISELYSDDRYDHQPEPIFNALLEWIDATTYKNATKNSISQALVRSYIRQLVSLDPKNKISSESCKTKDKLNFLLFSLRMQEHYVYGFASPAMLSWTKESKIIGIDGTFHSSPSRYYQVIIFVGRTDIMNVPLLFLVLPNKQELTYICAFNVYLQILKANGINFYPNVKFVCDFEMAEVNAIKSVFITKESTLQLCYFHYCKALKEKLGLICVKENFCEFTHNLYIILKILPFINRNSLLKFIKFLPKLEGYSIASHQFIKYFLKTFTIRYKIEDWNVSGKIQPNRATNNANESFNRKINSKLKKSPTIINFYHEISNIEFEYRHKYENLLLDPNKIKSEFLEDIEHDEVKIFREQILKLNAYKFFQERIKYIDDIFFGVGSNISEEQSNFSITNFKIVIPSFNIKSNK